MNAWKADLLSNSLAQRVRWALIHFLWQGTATGGKLLPRIRRIVGLPDRDSAGADRWLAGILIMAGLLAAGSILYGCAARAPAQQPVAHRTQETTWGDAVEGVQLCLRCDRQRWRGGQTITWRIDVRNTGKRHLRFAPHAYETVKIDVDGRVFDLPSTRGRARSYELKPGQEHRSISFSVSRRWQLKDHPFDLRPGKHTVRITLAVRPAKSEDGGWLRVTSNPVRIEVLPNGPPESASFGPVIERVIACRKGFSGEAAPEPGPMYLDLDTAAYVKLKALPTSRMIRGAGVDVYWEPGAGGTGARLATSNLQLQPLSEKAGWNSSPERLRRALLAASPYSLAHPGDSTLAFKTRDGGVGVLQILGLTEDRQGMRIRYKLVRPSSPAASRPTTRPGAAARASAGRLRRLWVALGSADYVEADKAAAAMVSAGDEAVAFLAGRFAPARIDAARVRQLIADLGSARFAVRKKAHDEFRALGRGALPAVKEALKQAELSAEARARVDETVKHWTRPPAGDAQGRRIEAAERVLVGIGTARSSGLLDRLVREQWLPWGEAVKGVQCRLRAKRSAWQVGQWPDLQADLRNRGKRKLTMGVCPWSWDIQCDGVWYHAAARYSGDIRILSIEPGRQENGIPLYVEARWHWRSKARNRPLALKTGKHTMRVAFRVALAGLGDCMVVSNPVAIEVVPAGKGPAT